jgi:hypothetical protein
MRLRDIYPQFTERSLPPEEPVTPVSTPSSANSPRMTEARQIVADWERIMGVKLREEIVAAHLETIRRWSSRLQRKA